jgi:hypothetical protein
MNKIATIQEPAAIDQMDQGMDTLRTVWVALHSQDLLTDDMVDALASTLENAINTLALVREKVNAAHGDDRI